MQETRDLFDLKGKVAVVTGGTGILGSLYCKKLAEAGAEVIIADIEEEQCVSLAEEINHGLNKRCAYGIRVDLAAEDMVIEWADRIRSQWGKLDILVNNAAAKSKHFFYPLDKFPLNDWNQVMSVNVTGIFLTVRELIPLMLEQGNGSIINISSIYGVAGPDQRIYEGSYYEELGGAINTPLVYSASKGAVVAMTKYLATYYGSKGVRTNTLTPGGVSSGQNGEFHRKYSNRVPLGRMAAPDDMIGALLFLASDASAYVNGQNIIVDGGLTAW